MRGSNGDDTGVKLIGGDKKLTCGDEVLGGNSRTWLGDWIFGGDRYISSTTLFFLYSVIYKLTG